MKKKRVKRDRIVPNRQLLARNLWALSLVDPVLVEKLKKTTVGEKFKLCQINGDASLNLYDNDKEELLYNTENIASELRENFGHLNLRNPQIAFFLGFGIGYELMYFLREVKKSTHTKYICIVEKDIERFKFALMCNDFSEVFTKLRITFFVGEDLSKLEVSFLDFFLEEQKFILSKAIAFIYNPTIYKEARHYYKSALCYFNDAALDARANYGNSPLDSVIGVENMFSNLDEIIENPGIKLIKNKFNSIPAVVVSTGPSLDKNKHLLKNVKGKALIISVDTSFKILMNEGIKPDIVLSMERGFEVKDIINGYTEEELEGIYFAFCPVIDRAAVKSYFGKKIVVYRNFDHFKWLEIDKGTVDSKMSVGNMAFKVAEYLGCSPIILTGQDLAFSSESDSSSPSHANGTSFIKDEKDQQKAINDLGKTLYVRGNLQSKILTSAAWYEFLRVYENDVRNYKGLCINSTEGGAYIKGTEVLPLAESIKKYMNIDREISTLLESSLNQFNKNNIEEFRDKFITMIEKSIVDIDSILESFQKTITYIEDHADELLDLMNETDESFLKKKLENYTEKIYLTQKKAIREYHKTFQFLIAHIIQSITLTHAINFNGVYEKYENWYHGEIEKMFMQKKYYEDEFRLIEITKGILIKTKNMLKTGKWEVSNLAIEYNKAGFVDIPKYLEEVKEIL